MGELGSVKLKFEWKSPMVWKIKTFIAASPWYAVTVICTMLLTLAEAVNVSRKIKILFLGQHSRTNKTSKGNRQKGWLFLRYTYSMAYIWNSLSEIFSKTSCFLFRRLQKNLRNFVRNSFILPLKIFSAKRLGLSFEINLAKSEPHFYRVNIASGNFETFSTQLHLKFSDFWVFNLIFLKKQML